MPEEAEEQLAEEDVEEVEEGEEPQPEEAQPPEAPQDGEKPARPKVATRKRAPAQVKKRAAKSQPKLFTGSAAGSPPPPAEACIGPPPEVGEPSSELGAGVYLIYNTDQGGSLVMKWSKEPLKGPGVLAYIKPSKEVGDFKFQKKGGIEALCSGLEVRSRCLRAPAQRVIWGNLWPVQANQSNSIFSRSQPRAAFDFPAWGCSYVSNCCAIAFTAVNLGVLF